jgi:hypothetical protein
MYMNPIVTALISLLESFAEAEGPVIVQELITELEKFLPKAKAKLANQLPVA